MQRRCRSKECKTPPTALTRRSSQPLAGSWGSRRDDGAIYPACSHGRCAIAALDLRSER